MRQLTLEYVRCVRCRGKLDAEILVQDSHIEEGFLSCSKCRLLYPIIGKVPILWNDFAAYLSVRPRLGGELLLGARTAKMRSFVKNALGKIRKGHSDFSVTERHWVSVYKNNKGSKFYSAIKRHVRKIPQRDVSLEHGCSVGYVTSELARTSSVSFGIDRSYYAIEEAIKSANKNTDFIVADSLEHPFGREKFDAVVGLNLLELIEPRHLLRVLTNQVRNDGWLVLSDPYDFERGIKSVKKPLYEHEIRKYLAGSGFAISKQTKAPSYIPWSLALHKRATLQYAVDVIVAKKSK